MLNFLLKPLDARPQGRRARAALAVLLLFTAVNTGASAQSPDAVCDGSDEAKVAARDLFAVPRTNTWSVYAQGGLSWASSVGYENINARKSYGQYPAFGAGVDYNIRPWVRVGAEYLTSGYRREQRISALDISAGPSQAYGKLSVLYHKAKIGADFNIMELWPHRRAKCLNLYLGTGVGMLFGKASEYSLLFGTEIIKDGVSQPVTGNIDISNTESISVRGNATSKYVRSTFNSPYIPLNLHFEVDVTPQLTLGLKGECDWTLTRSGMTPGNLFAALATIRINLVPSKAQILRRRCAEQRAKMKSCYDRRISALEEDARKTAAESDEYRRKAEDMEKANVRLAEENSALKALVEDYSSRKSSLTVYFDNNSSVLSAEQTGLLNDYLSGVQDKYLSIIAESSAPGSEAHNLRLSEYRLQSVMRAIESAGIDTRNVVYGKAIGELNGKAGDDGRCVTITAENK